MSGWDIRFEVLDRTTSRASRGYAQTVPRDGLHRIVIGALRVGQEQCAVLVDDAGCVAVRNFCDTMLNGERLAGVAPFGLDDRLEFADYVFRLVDLPTPITTTWRVTFEITSRGGHHLSTRVVEHKARIVFGRAADCDLVLDNGNVSRHHHMFLIDRDGEVWIEDLGSTNGMHINGERAVFCTVRPGDQVMAGNWQIRLVEPPVRIAP